MSVARLERITSGSATKRLTLSRHTSNESFNFQPVPQILNREQRIHYAFSSTTLGLQIVILNCHHFNLG